MKVFRASLLCLFAGICMQSCQNDELETENGNTSEIVLPREGLLLDGGRISDISLYCLELDKPHIGEQWWEYYPRTKTVKGYDAFKLLLFPHTNGNRYNSGDRNEMDAIKKIEEAYYKEKSMFILEAYNEYNKTGVTGWPDVFTAYATEDITITCDKVLFGEQPGTNLTSHFALRSDVFCVPVEVEEPKLLYGFGETPTRMSDLLVKGAWLQNEYYMEFAEQPAEKYDELTLSLSCPMLLEHTRDLAAAKYKGTELASKYSEKVFTSKCLIKFNWDK